MSGHTTHFTIFRDERQEWQRTLIAAKKIARSTHGYHTKHDVLRSAKALSPVSYNATIFNAEDDAYEM